MVDKICEKCGKTFIIKPHDKDIVKYCSNQCYWESKKKRIKEICHICGNEFTIKLSRKTIAKYCSAQCYRIAQKGRPSHRKGKEALWMIGQKHPNWKGRVSTGNDGYIFIHCKNHPYRTHHNYVLEHRLVVEKQIGRYLKPTEHVHHLGERDDNRPHLLIAFASQGAHNRFERGKHVEPREIIYDGRIHEVSAL